MLKPVKRREWKDLGSKPNSSKLQPTTKSEPYYPSLYLDSKQIGVLPLDIDSEVTFIIQAKVVSFSKGKDGKISYSFDLKKLKVVPPVSAEEEGMTMGEDMVGD